VIFAGCAPTRNLHPSRCRPRSRMSRAL
jgi:hypothetical protein